MEREKPTSWEVKVWQDRMNKVYDNLAENYRKNQTFRTPERKKGSVKSPKKSL